MLHHQTYYFTQKHPLLFEIMFLSVHNPHEAWHVEADRNLRYLSRQIQTADERPFRFGLHIQSFWSLMSHTDALRQVGHRASQTAHYNHARLNADGGLAGDAERDRRGTG